MLGKSFFNNDPKNEGDGSGSSSCIVTPTEPSPSKQNESESNKFSEIAASSIKLPMFWTRFPTAWFVCVEQQFNGLGIRSDIKKLQYILAAMPEDVVATVVDVIQNPNNRSYEVLKEALISRHSISEQKKLESLFVNTEMGDQKPSQFYRSLEMLAGNSDSYNQKLLERIWMTRIPRSISIAIMGSAAMDIHDKIKLADDIWEASNGSTCVAAVSRSSSHPPSSNSNAPKQVNADLCSVVAEMASRLMHIEQEIGELRSNNRNYNQGRSRFRGRSKSPHSLRSRSRSHSQNGRCWYHSCYGERATKCRSPCNYKSKSSGTNSHQPTNY